MKKAGICIAMLAASLAAQAQESPWRFFGGIGYAQGGEKMSSGTVTHVSTKLVIPFDIQAGAGFQRGHGL
jgi:hypothetical protein